MNSPGHNGEPPSGAGGSHDDWFGPGDDGPTPGMPVFTVPDDISELDAEVQQYRREVKRARRRTRAVNEVRRPGRCCGRILRRFVRLFRSFRIW